MDISQFKNLKVLCIGDLMLDSFVYGNAQRISPEAPVPILKKLYQRDSLGGAGNVVSNLLELGANVICIGVIGNDSAGNKILGLMEQYEKLEAYVLSQKSRTTTTKVRFVGENQQIMRLDDETEESIELDVEEKIKDLIKQTIQDVDVVIISDYNKGTITNGIKQMLSSRFPEKIKILDTKSNDLTYYSGMNIITPNIQELGDFYGRKIQTSDQIREFAEKLIKNHKSSKVLVTKSEQGMSLFEVKETGNIKETCLDSCAKTVVDVSGAGDTVVATLALAIASGFNSKDAVYLANLAAAIVVGKQGTATINIAELQLVLDHQNHIEITKDIKNLKELVKFVKSQGKTIGFTNGCFDLFHAGHINFLHKCKKECDFLLVAVNSDQSVKQIKGKNRPIHDELTRFLNLKNSNSVDHVILFDEQTPLELIKEIKPDVLFKGSDYKKNQVVGRQEVMDAGGRVEIIKSWKEYTTSKLILRARESND